MMRVIVSILVLYVFSFLDIAYAQEPVDSVAVKAASEQTAPVKKKKKKLTKEEKQRIRDLNAVVKTAKYKYTKEEKKQIDKLTILEQDLNEWLEDQHTEWFNYGVVEIIQNADKNQAGIWKKKTDPRGSYDVGGDLAELYIKNGKTKTQIRVFFRGINYDCERHNTYVMNSEAVYEWRFNDLTLTEWLFNLPEDLKFILHKGEEHPTYKQYNPWEYLIDLDKQAGKFSQEDMQKEMNAIRKNAIKAKKAEQKKQKELEKAEKQAAKAKK